MSAEYIFKLKAEELTRDGGVVIGSDAEICDYPAADKTIAPRHLRVTVKDKIVHLEDLNGGSGTTLDDQHLAPFQPTPLRKSAVIRLGGTEIALEILPAAAQAAPPLAYADAPLRRPKKSRMGVLALVVLGGVLVVVAIAGAGYGYQYYKAWKIEETAWQKTVEANEIPTFTAYITAYPHGRHRDKAILAIERIQREKKEAELAADKATFELAKEVDTIFAFESYIRLYPKGVHLEDAKAEIARLKEKRAREENAEAERAAWDKAEQTKKKSDYERYLKEHPQGANAGRAKAAIAAINNSEAERRRREADAKAQRESAIAEQRAFKDARRQDTVAAYRTFLRKYPNSTQASEVRNLIGFLYANGRSVAKDPKEGVRWFREAAERGHSQAMMNLAYHYRYGLGVTKDPKKAANWYRKADAAGHKFAKPLLKDLQKETGVR